MPYPSIFCMLIPQQISTTQVRTARELPTQSYLLASLPMKRNRSLPGTFWNITAPITGSAKDTRHLIFWIQNILFMNYPSVLPGFFCRMVTMNAWLPIWTAKNFRLKNWKLYIKCGGGIETSFWKLKYTIGMSNLHSKIQSTSVRKYLGNWFCIYCCWRYLRDSLFNNIEQLINRSLTPVKPERQYKWRVIKKRWISFTFISSRVLSPSVNCSIFPSSYGT